MNIGAYSFAEFRQKAAEFHGYPAPGLLIGGYMVEMARAALPRDVLFEAVVETRKCLPDAVQLLTPCSTGNNWMKVLNLGKYALSLFDKHSGEGFRVHVDVEKLTAWPELAAWFLKRKAKAEQDADLLLREIENAGDSICSISPVRMRTRLLGHAKMGGIAVCSVCGEAFPRNDGPLCRGCQGEAPYLPPDGSPNDSGESRRSAPLVRVLPVEEAVGKTALHDMTEIIPGRSKGAAFSAGQTISAGDVCRLQQMGRFSVAVAEGVQDGDSVHENAGAEAFAARMASENIAYDLPPKEGKINFRAKVSGLFTLDRERLKAFNLVPDVMAATRQDGLLVEAGSEVAGTRVIPLYLDKTSFAQALAILEQPLFSIAPLRAARVGVLVTGSEVFQGLVKDRFIPVISAKVEQLGCTVVKTGIVPDKAEHIRRGIEEVRAAGADLLAITGGLSVDPDDITRAVLVEAGLTDIVYGAPVLPGAMSLAGKLPDGIQVIGVPACALYFKTTFFDALLPRLLAGRTPDRAEFAALGEGGFCMNCKVCTWPKCFFLK